MRSYMKDFELNPSQRNEPLEMHAFKSWTVWQVLLCSQDSNQGKIQVSKLFLF